MDIRFRPASGCMALRRHPALHHFRSAAGKVEFRTALSLASPVVAGARGRHRFANLSPAGGHSSASADRRCHF